MPDVTDGTSPVPTALRRCPGCRNLVTTQTPLCPVCGKHAVVARVMSALRWTVIVAGTVAFGWWWSHHG
jgi:hypothetical protein